MRLFERCTKLFILLAFVSLSVVSIGCEESGQANSTASDEAGSAMGGGFGEDILADDSYGPIEGEGGDSTDSSTTENETDGTTETDTTTETKDDDGTSSGTKDDDGTSSDDGESK